MVYEIGFPIFCKIETLLNKYPAAIPANMMPMTVNIADLYKRAAKVGNNSSDL